MPYEPAGVEIEVVVLGNRLLGAYQAELRAAAKTAVRNNLERIQRDWAADVRVASGELRDSILEPTAIEIAPNGLEGVVATDCDHAEVNEYGGPTISARPSGRQAAEKNRPRFESEMARLTQELER
jgi:hypothetical protein